MDTARARGGTESKLGKYIIWGALFISSALGSGLVLTISLLGGGGYKGRLISGGLWVGLSLGDPYRRGGNKLSGVPCTSVNSATVRLQYHQQQQIAAIPASHSQILERGWRLGIQI